MFDKNKFAQIIREIKETYISQEDFSKKSGIGRTYLSQYMNMKLEQPPKPSILKKIANNSNDIVSYYELMQICGYVVDDNIAYDEIFNKYIKSFKDIGLNKEQIIKIYDITLQKNNTDFLTKLKPLLDSLTDKKDEKVLNILLKIMNDREKFSKDKSTLLKKEIDKRNIKISVNNNIVKVDDFLFNERRYYNCPVYGQISAGQPNWAEECLEGYLPLDPELMGIINPEEHYFLRVNGESMNKIVHNGAFALIHKQDTVENGEIAVVLVNGDNATLKRFSQKENIIVLTPESTDDSFKQQIYTKDTRIQVIGKYVGKMEFNK